jgi:hypothetical protein
MSGVSEEIKQAADKLRSFEKPEGLIPRKEPGPVVICQPTVHVNFRGEDFVFGLIDYLAAFAMGAGFICMGLALK